MMKKAIALSLVIMMCLSAVVLFQSEDASADEITGKIRPSDNNNESTISYSLNSLVYDPDPYSSRDYRFYDSYVYYESDPKDTVLDFAKGVDLTLEGYKKVNELEEGRSYYAVKSGRDGSSMDWTWETASIKMDLLYLPAGTYEVKFTSNTMDKTACRVTEVNDRSGRYFDDFSDGKGVVKMPLTEPGSFYVRAYSTEGSSDPIAKFSWVMDYTISPAPKEQRTVVCDKNVTVGTDKMWVKYTARTALPAGEYIMNEYSGNPYYYFIRGSGEESAFVTNVVDKGLSDGTAYKHVGNFVLDGNSYIDVYTLDDALNPRSYYTNFGANNITDHNYYNFTADPETIKEPSQYKFYGSQHFSVAVDYNDDDYEFVVLRSGATCIYMEQNKLYSVDASTASEYMIYAILADGSTASIESADIKMYTENVADSDGAGVAFAAVSIGFCAIAFFMLFWFGRRPKWDDSTGLPKTGSVETVVNEVSEVPEEVPEAPADEVIPEGSKEE